MTLPWLTFTGFLIAGACFAAVWIIGVLRFYQAARRDDGEPQNWAYPQDVPSKERTDDK